MSRDGLWIMPRRNEMSRYNEKDAARDTESKVGEVRRAWHGARDDAAGSGHLNERNDRKWSDSDTGSILGKFFRVIGLYGTDDN